mmetsp:Transcript_93683/g.200999  ORF Transcript_93683/g.200999 Transcript_93683/m.200999 type:complete len:231 (-) Transcript_93683:150-842(-)
MLHGSDQLQFRDATVAIRIDEVVKGAQLARIRNMLRGTTTEVHNKVVVPNALLAACNCIKDGVYIIEALLVPHQEAAVTSRQDEIGYLSIAVHSGDEFQLGDGAILVSVDPLADSEHPGIGAEALRQQQGRPPRGYASASAQGGVSAWRQPQSARGCGHASRRALPLDVHAGDGASRTGTNGRHALHAVPARKSGGTWPYPHRRCGGVAVCRSAQVGRHQRWGGSGAGLR